MADLLRKNPSLIDKILQDMSNKEELLNKFQHKIAMEDNAKKCEEGGN